MVFDGPVNITGIGPRNSSVQLRDSSGTLLGVATADINGAFSVDDIALPNGSHSLRAVCTRPSGGVVESSEIEVEVTTAIEAAESTEADDLESMLSFAERFELRQLRRENEERIAEQRAAADAHYVEMIEAFCDGYEIDDVFGELVIEASGRTLDDFSRDVDELLKLRRELEFSERLWRIRMDELKRRASMPAGSAGF